MEELVFLNPCSFGCSPSFLLFGDSISIFLWGPLLPRCIHIPFSLYVLSSFMKAIIAMKESESVNHLVVSDFLGPHGL